MTPVLLALFLAVAPAAQAVDSNPLSKVMEMIDELSAKIIKEGGKKGVEIEGASDMGGLDFFCTTMELPDGDAELLLMSMDAMNAVRAPSPAPRPHHLRLHSIASTPSAPPPPSPSPPPPSPPPAASPPLHRLHLHPSRTPTPRPRTARAAPATWAR